MRYILILLMVGMLSGGEACGYAQPDDDVQVFTSGSKRGAWLGVSLQDVTDRLAGKKNLSVKEGAFVSEVMEESPAEKAGIKEGDVIVTFDGKSVEESSDLTRLVQKKKPGTGVEVELVRDGAKKTINVTLGKRPREVMSWATPRPPMAMTIPKISPHVRVFVSTESEMLGMEMQELGRQLAEYFEVPGKKGVLVIEVEKGGEAVKAGFAAGDVIAKVNNAAVSDVDEVMEEIHDARTGDEIVFDVIRKGKSVSLKITKKEEDDDEKEDSYYREGFHGSHGEGIAGFSSFRNGMLQLKEELTKMKHDLRMNLGRLRTQIQRHI
jgi:serine protease Do